MRMRNTTLVLAFLWVLLAVMVVRGSLAGEIDTGTGVVLLALLAALAPIFWRLFRRRYGPRNDADPPPP